MPRNITLVMLNISQLKHCKKGYKVKKNKQINPKLTHSMQRCLAALVLSSVTWCLAWSCFV